MQFQKIRMTQDVLREARKKLNLSQQEVADRALIKLRQYQRYESGELALPASTFDIACRVLSALELDISSFARGDYFLSEDTVEVPINHNDLSADSAIANTIPNEVFNDKICVFIGKPERCSRQAAKDMLFQAGGVPQNSLAVFVSYVITGRGVEGTKVYRAAQKLEQQGFLTIIMEQEFFDVLEGNYVPPENPNSNKFLPEVTLASANAPVDDFTYVLGRKRAAYATSRNMLIHAHALRQAVELRSVK